LIRVLVFGASGYTGAELVKLVCAHPDMTLVQALNSGSSAAEVFDQIHPGLAANSRATRGIKLVPATQQALDNLPDADAAFLALPHEVSATLAPKLITRGIRVFDLSGAFRINDAAVFERFYGFKHPNFDHVDQAFYCLMDWQKPSVDELLCSIPGCYPTASSLALLPVLSPSAVSPLIDGQQWRPLSDSGCTPVVNAVSGVTGAGRKASLALSFAEVSFMAYGVAQHRHTPEIEQNIGCKVQFTPHIAPFKRGLMATCILKLSDAFSDAQHAEIISGAYAQAYASNPSIRLCTAPPRIDDVVGSGLCDLYWHIRDGHLVVVAAIDNLLKGAATQAVQAANVVFGLNEYLGIPGVESAHE